jgi:hypothetical protein
MSQEVVVSTSLITTVAQVSARQRVQVLVERMLMPHQSSFILHGLATAAHVASHEFVFGFVSPIALQISGRVEDE